MLWQPPATGSDGYQSTNVGMSVAQGVAVTGTNAVVVGQSGSGSNYGYVYATIDNAETLNGTSGVAFAVYVNASFSPEVSRSIAYGNDAGGATGGQHAVRRGAAAAQRHRRLQCPGVRTLTPEAYASASQFSVDNALTLAGVARGGAFATLGDAVHAYTLAQTVGGWPRLSDNPDPCTAATHSQSYGFLSDIGIGDGTWSVGAFASYLNDRQQIDAPGARTKADGVVADVNARYLTGSGFGITASVLYDGGDGRTVRALPGGGGSAFALTVARDRHVAGLPTLPVVRQKRRLPRTVPPVRVIGGTISDQEQADGCAGRLCRWRTRPGGAGCAAR